MRGRQAGGSLLPFFTWQIYLAEGTQVSHERQEGGSRLPFFTWQIYLAEGPQVNHERQAGWRVMVTVHYLADLSV
jgi:hypothetical protein